MKWSPSTAGPLARDDAASRFVDHGFFLGSSQPALNASSHNRINHQATVPWSLSMFSRKLIRSIAIGTAAIAVATGAYAIVNSSSSNGASGTANAATLTQPGQNQRVVGQLPRNWRPGSGTIVTGAAGSKAKAAALAKYPGGTVNRVLKLSDGSYAVHKIKIRWPHHVFVSKNFKAIGAIG
jgi:hypothetical protein